MKSIYLQKPKQCDPITGLFGLLHYIAEGPMEIPESQDPFLGFTIPTTILMFFPSACHSRPRHFVWTIYNNACLFACRLPRRRIKKVREAPMPIPLRRLLCPCSLPSPWLQDCLLWLLTQAGYALIDGSRWLHDILYGTVLYFKDRMFRFGDILASATEFRYPSDSGPTTLGSQGYSIIWRLGSSCFIYKYIVCPGLGWALCWTCGHRQYTWTRFKYIQFNNIS